MSIAELTAENKDLSAYLDNWGLLREEPRLKYKQCVVPIPSEGQAVLQPLTLRRQAYLIEVKPPQL